jgi:putative phage-type endonuclease
VAKKKSLDQFHDERRSGIGGTDVAKIIGASKYGTAYSVWREKLRLETDSKESTPRLEFGVMMEKTIAKYFAEKSGYKYKGEHAQLRSKKHPFLVGHIDGWLIPKKATGLTNGVIDVKTTSRKVFNTWEGQVPREYYCQLQHYLYISGAKWAKLVVLITETREIIDYTIEYDPKFYNTILPSLVDFWNKNVLKKVEPILTAEDYGTIEETDPESIEADVAIAEAYGKLREVVDHRKEVEIEEEVLKTQIKEYMGAKDAMTCNGQVIVTWKLVKGRRSFDLKKFTADNPDLANKYTAVGKPSRQFRPRFSDDETE